MNKINNFFFKPFRIVNFNLCFEEWLLKEYSDAPGWTNVKNYLYYLISKNIPFRLFTFKYRLIKHCYVLRKEFYSIKDKIIPSKFPNVMYSNAIIIIRLYIEVPLDTLLLNYELFDKGIINDNCKSKVFSKPVEANSWYNIEKNEKLIVIHHDGDPIHILEPQHIPKS